MAYTLKRGSRRYLVNDTVGSPLDPTAFGTASIWIKADGLGTQGASINAWPNLITGGGAFVAPNSSPPSANLNIINGHDGAHFVPNNRLDNTAVNVLKPFSVFAVVRSTGSGNRFFQGTSVNWLLGPYNGNWQFFDGAGFVGTPPAVTLGVPVIYSATVINGLSKYWINGAFAGQSANSTSPGFMSLGAGGTFLECFTGDLSELIVYSQDMTSDARHTAEAYLSVRYNIAVAVV